MAEPDVPSTKYVVDASSWISVEGHPAQNRILHAIVGLIEAGRLECPPEAWDEVERCPWVHAWIDQHKEVLIQRHRTKVDYLVLIGQIAHQYPKMSGTRGRKNKADPYILAHAIFGNRTHNATRFAVVTNEGLVGRNKIPKACQDHGVDCMTLIEMLKKEFPDEGWE